MSSTPLPLLPFAGERNGSVEEDEERRRPSHNNKKASPPPTSIFESNRTDAKQGFIPLLFRWGKITKYHDTTPQKKNTEQEAPESPRDWLGGADRLTYGTTPGWPTPRRAAGAQRLPRRSAPAPTGPPCRSRSPSSPSRLLSRATECEARQQTKAGADAGGTNNQKDDLRGETNFCSSKRRMSGGSTRGVAAGNSFLPRAARMSWGVGVYLCFLKQRQRR